MRRFAGAASTREGGGEGEGVGRPVIKHWLRFGSKIYCMLPYCHLTEVCKYARSGQTQSESCVNAGRLRFVDG